MSLVLEAETCRTILESLPSGLYIVDRERRILLWNDGAERITGYLRQEVIGRRCQQDLLMHCDERHNLLCDECCPLLGTIHDGSPREVEVFLRHKTGETVPVCVRVSPVRDADGAIVGAVQVFDIRSALAETPSCAGPEVLDRTDDVETGQVESRLAAALEGSRPGGRPPAVISISLDQLELVRQSHGSLAAAALLRAVGHTLAHSLHPGDAAGRGAADGLVAVLVDCPPEAVRPVADRIRRILGMVAVPWWGDRLATTVTVGAALARSGDSAEGLFSRSAEALAAGVLGGGDRVEIA